MKDRYQPKQRRIEFSAINFLAQRHADDLVRRWLPDGRMDGREYVARNPKRDDQSLGSFRINLTTGKWADFATGDKGGDLISLYAYLNDMSQFEAAKALNETLGGRK